MEAQQEAMDVVTTTDLATNGLPADFDATKPNIADLVKTPHNTRLYQATQTLKRQINELVEYQLAHPKNPKLATREEMDNEKKISREITAKERQIRMQLSLVKALYRQGVLKVREEKAKTADDRAVDDALILGLHNLKYEEQSLRSEIAAAENYEYVLSFQYASWSLTTIIVTNTLSYPSFPRKSFSRSFRSTRAPPNTTS
jgi:THO complex subunit 5